MSYDNTDKGALFKNEKKETSRHPDYKGSINAGGTEYWVSAWVNEAKESGKKYLSLSLTAKDAEHNNVKQSQPLEDDVPF